ncbi:cytochrome P450 [Brunnivagina elsteri]|uniref:Cytochrome P450 n=1 Tax=Brunnivagina elsteri CCALA 953 TaxID=987040 RepID=A0A2A2TL85_9CYAN|nr:cytochrome P450 [Calothrix elsteri]PAX56532.1 cytochrome P450 [Calothrix elsteri CCALA 953]
MKLDTPSQTLKDPFSLPGPKGKFLAGNAIDFGKNPLFFLTQCAKEYGEIVPIHLGQRKAVVVTNPKYVEYLLKDREVFVKPEALKSMRSLLGQGLLTSEGETWFHQRRLAQPVFHQKRIGGYADVMVDYTEIMLAHWKDGETKNIQAEMMRLTFNIVMKTLFSSDVTEEQARDVSEAMHVSADWMLKQRRSFITFPESFPTPSNLHYKNAIDRLNKQVYQIIKQRRASGEDPGDLLSMMMNARDEDDGSQMSDKQLRDEITTLIFAGHETTANTLAWTWMLLSQYPEAQAKLQQEVKQVLGDRPPTFADLPALSYTSAIVKETMRLYPVVWNIIAETSRECEMGDYRIGADWTVISSPWVMHRSEAYFEQAELFKPERWEGDFEKKLPNGVYTPFGGGPRTCIGKSFALMEAALLLVAIAQKFEISLVPNQTIIPQATITLQPKNSIQVVLKQRD